MAGECGSEDESLQLREDDAEIVKFLGNGLRRGSGGG